MIETAGYIPCLEKQDIAYQTMKFEKNGECVEVEVPLLTNEQLDIVMARVAEASRTILKEFTVAEIVALLDKVIGQLLDRKSFYRQKAEKLLPIVTGYDEELVRLGLTNYLKTFRKQQLQRFLVEDFGNPLVLDDFQPRAKRGYTKAVGPDFIAQVWSGNVPALPLWSFISSLMVKSGVIGKIPSSEPLFAGWFAKMLVEAEPKLADCMAVIWWKGGDESKEKQLFQEADLVLAYGGNETLASLKSRVPITTRFLPFGHKLSFGIVSKASLDSQKAWKTIHQAAYDIVRYDQQGCYSPHIIYVQKGGNVSPREFARYLANELEAFETRYPRRKLSIEEAAAMAAWKQKEEISTLYSKEKEMLGNSKEAWTVVFAKGEINLEPSCLNRVIKVAEITELTEMIPYVAHHRDYLQTVGIACTPEELFYMADRLASAGATRITGLGSMTSPEAGWHHDGRCSLLDLVNMVDIEHSAEEYAESLAFYVD